MSIYSKLHNYRMSYWYIIQMNQPTKWILTVRAGSGSFMFLQQVVGSNRRVDNTNQDGFRIRSPKNPADIILWTQYLRSLALKSTGIYNCIYTNKCVGIQFKLSQHGNVKHGGPGRELMGGHHLQNWNPGCSLADSCVSKSSAVKSGKNFPTNTTWLTK